MAHATAALWGRAQHYCAGRAYSWQGIPLFTPRLSSGQSGARRWSARLSASSATQVGRRASLPYRGMPCHLPALFACSAQSAAPPLRGRIARMCCPLRCQHVRAMLGICAMPHFPQRLFRSLAAPASSWLSPLVRTAIFAASLPH